MYFIKASGAIEHKNERYELNTASGNSFGRQKGWVCLFDCRNFNPETRDTQENNYNFLRPGWFRKEPYKDWAEYSLAYLILDSKYFGQLIPYEKFNEHVENTNPYPMAVPKFETWIADKVLIAWIEKVIFANFGEPLSPHEIQISRAHQNLSFK